MPDVLQETLQPPVRHLAEYRNVGGPPAGIDNQRRFEQELLEERVTLLRREALQELLDCIDIELGCNRRTHMLVESKVEIRILGAGWQDDLVTSRPDERSS